MRDLAPYSPKSILADQSAIFTTEATVGSFNNGKFESTHGALNALFNKWPETLLNLNFNFTFNEWDMPRMVPSATPYETPKKLAEIDNECVREVYSDPVLLNANYYLRSGIERARTGYVYTNSSSNLIFSQAKALCLQDFAVPMSYHWNIAGETHLDEQPFSQKISGIVWRGSNTGTDNGQWREDEDYSTFIRIRALEWERQFKLRHPERVFVTGRTEPFTKNGFAVDFGLNQFIGDQSVSSAQEAIKKYPVKPSLNAADLKKFKYLLMLDGNSWPSRLQSLIQYNSVLLYPRVFFDWYSWYLVPYKHFVPLKLDLSDLEEKLECLERNPDIAEEIIRNAHEAIKVFNRREQMQCHVAFGMIHLQDLV